MLVRGPTHETSMVDLLDRILDKGIVIDIWARVILTGVDLGIRCEVRMVVAALETYLKHAGPIGLLGKYPAWYFQTSQRVDISSVADVPGPQGSGLSFALRPKSRHRVLS